MPTCACGAYMQPEEWPYHCLHCPCAYMQPEEWPYHCLHCPDATLAGRRTQLTDTGAQPRQRPTQLAITRCCGYPQYGVACRDCNRFNPALQNEAPATTPPRRPEEAPATSEFTQVKEAS